MIFDQDLVSRIVYLFVFSHYVVNKLLHIAFVFWSNSLAQQFEGITTLYIEGLFVFFEKVLLRLVFVDGAVFALLLSE